MRSQTLSIFLFVIFFAIAISFAEVTDDSLMLKRDHPGDNHGNTSNGYGGDMNAKNSASTAELSFMTVVVVTLASLVRFLI